MNELIRSFVAIELPAEIKTAIDSYIQQIRKLAPNIKWAKAASIHITLKFLGEQPPELIDKTLAGLLPVSEIASPFQLTVTQFGAFPNEKRPRVFWLGIESQPAEPLFTLQSWIEERLVPLGFEKERRRFSPHLTMARVKFPENFAALWSFVQANPFPAQSFAVHEIVLMRSLLKPSGAEYRPVQKYSLRGL